MSTTHHLTVQNARQTTFMKLASPPCHTQPIPLTLLRLTSTIFGRLKNNLLGQIFRTEDELKTAVLDDIHKITGMELRRVFNNWILRLEQCVLNAGKYTE